MIFQESHIQSLHKTSKLQDNHFIKIHGLKYQIDENKNTVLHLACESGNKHLIKKLLKKKPFLDIKNNQHKTPLNLALENNFFDILKILLKCGANINSTMQFGETSLHRATACNDTVKTRCLLDNKANTNSLDYENWSPLHWACYNYCYDTVIILLKYNANVNAKDNCGSYPIHKCLDDYETSIKINLLINQNPKYNKIKIVKELVSYGANVNIVDNIGRSPMYFCSDLEIFNYLFENGANINFRSDNGNTPLHYASLNGNLEIVKKLLQNNVNYTQMNNDLESASDICNNGLISEEFISYENIQIDKQKTVYTIYKCNVNEVCKFKELCDDIEILILCFLK